MKNKIPFLLIPMILSMSPAYAQSTAVDIDAINQKSAAEVSALAEKAREGDTRALNVLKKFFLSGITPHFEKIAKARTLTPIELNQAQLLKCVDGILNERMGGYESPSIAFNLLKIATDQNGWTSDTAQLQQAQTQCDEFHAKLLRFKRKDVDQKIIQEKISSLIIENAAQKKSVSIIQNLLSNEIDRCIQSQVAVSGAWLIGADVHLGITKCLNKNGKVKVYFSPGAAITLGVSAVFEIKTVEIHDILQGGIGSLMFEETYEDATPLTLGTAKVDVFGDGNPLNNTFAVGLGSTVNSPSFSIGLRTLNGKRHWDKLVDLMK